MKTKKVQQIKGIDATLLDFQIKMAEIEATQQQLIEDNKKSIALSKQIIKLNTRIIEKWTH